MRSYNWSCFACGASNNATDNACAVCLCPAEATAHEMATHKAQLAGEPLPPAPSGRTVITWALIVFFILGGGFSFIRTIGQLVGLIKSEIWFDAIYDAFSSVVSFGIAWYLYKQNKKAIILAWIFPIVSFCVFLLMLLLDEKLRNVLPEIAWKLVISYIRWGIFLWYLHFLNRQGRLYA